VVDSFLLSLDRQQTVPFWQALFPLGTTVHTEDIIWGMHTPGQPGVLGGLGVFPGLPSSFLVTQQRPLPGHLAERSSSSQRRAKKPETQVPLQRFPSSLGVGFGLLVVVVVVLFVVVLFVVVDLGLGVVRRPPCWLGMTSSGGGSSPKSCFATQHLSWFLQRWSTSRMASQKPESLSATQTPGQLSADERVRLWTR